MAVQKTNWRQLGVLAFGLLAAVLAYAAFLNREGPEPSIHDVYEQCMRDARDLVRGDTTLARQVERGCRQQQTAAYAYMARDVRK